MIYQYPALAQADWPVYRPVGFVLGDAHTRPITRAATVLSNMRWAASFAYHAGATFSSGEVWFFVPVGSSGRWATQAIVQSPNTFTYSGISLQTMTGTSTYQSWTGTSSTLANPTDLRGTSSGTWWCSSRMYPGSTSYALMGSGCSRLRLYGLTGTAPLGVSVIGYPYPGYSTSTTSGVAGWRYDGRLTPGWVGDTYVPSLSAAWARAIEEDLEVAEAMPVVIGILPYNASGVSAFESSWSQQTIRRAFSKQIPLAPPRRRKCVVAAIYATSTTNSLTLQIRVGGQVCSQWQSVYTSGAYRVVKCPLDTYAYEPVSTVSGVPVVNVRLLQYQVTISITNVNAMTVWITEDW